MAMVKTISWPGVVNHHPRLRAFLPAAEHRVHLSGEPLRTLMEEQPLTLQVLLQPRAHGLEVVGDAAFQAAGSHTGGLHVGGHAFGRGRQGLGVHQQALLARVEAPVGGKQNVEVAGQPSRSPVIEADSIPSTEGRANLLLVRMDDAPKHRQVQLYNSLHEPIRVRGRFDSILEGLKSTPAIEHRRGMQDRVA